MSRIYFHSEHGTAEVHGPERAHAGVLSQDLTMAALGQMYFTSAETPPILKVVGPRSRLHRYDHRTPGSFNDAFRLWLDYSDTADFILPDGHTVGAWDVTLNTAHALGCDAVKLLTRLHAQCEIHCYVEGPNRSWLARIIDDGRLSGILRKDMGWESVMDLLQHDQHRPVVCSYSVCEQFPNRYVAVWAPPTGIDEDGYEYEGYDAWYDLPEDERWQLAIAALRKQGQGKVFDLEIKPETFSDYVYGAGVNAFKLMEYCR